MTKFQSEPAVVIGAVEALAIAIIALVASLAGWSGDTVALVVGVVSAAIAVVSSIVVRSQVAPVAELTASD